MRPTARSRLALLAVAVALSASAVGVTVGCEGDPSAPERLADGGRARLSDVEFEGLDLPVITTEVRAARTVASPCAHASRTVDRVGAEGASRTSRSRDATGLRACDWTPTSGWCGNAFARMRGGRPLDPRLSITCRDPDGQPLGFLWIAPGRDATHIVVTGREHAESYPVVAGAPVRVTAGRVDLTTSSATVAVSEHGADGRRLRTRLIEAQVSG